MSVMVPGGLGDVALDGVGQGVHAGGGGQALGHGGHHIGVDDGDYRGCRVVSTQTNLRFFSTSVMT